MKRKLFFCCLLLLPIFCMQAAAGEFPLRIDDVSGIDSPWPLVASIPFPEGELAYPSAIRITSGVKEVPSQVDVAATWRDGSIRWTLAGFTASPGADYMVEYGKGVKREAYPHPLTVQKSASGDFTVNTGTAIYQFDNDKLLPEKAWLISGNRRTLMLDGSGAGAYLVDNAGREARVSGREAEIENTVLKEGPGRFVLKRSGWYVTGEGERLARADAWLYFAAGTPYFKVTHSLILTEDTNKVWIKDYGLEFKTPDVPSDVYFSRGEAGKEAVKHVSTDGKEIYMLQDVYPHFAERDYRAVIGSGKSVMEEFKTAGDWAHGDYGNYGITLVMPWLSERFPKEISFGERGARAVLWSGRSGRELDFRSKTLVEEYWQTWAKKGRGSPGKERLSRIPNNAQGSAHTHDIWFLPHPGGFNPETVKKAGLAAARAPLTMADPEWVCSSEAMGFPMRHKDKDKFPEEEEYISDSWDRFTIPNRVFPMTGFINWGHCPYLSYHYRDGQWFASFKAYGNMNAYNARRNVWHLYARSGERRYHDYGHAFNRISGDFAIARWEAPGKPRGAFTRTLTPIHFLPFYWGNTYLKFDMGNSSSDIGHWLMEYYLTGNEASRELTVEAGESIKRLWNLGEALDWEKTLSFLALRKLSILYTMEWDEDFKLMADELAHSLIKLDAQTGVNADYMSYRDAMYKDQRHTLDLYFYYRATGDEKGKRAFLKILDHRYRYNRIPKAVSYLNNSAFAYSIAYWMTGNEKYRTVAEETLKDGMEGFSLSLEEELEEMGGNPYELKRLPRLNNPSQTHPFLGVPTVLKLIAEKGRSESHFPVLIKSNDITPADILFRHPGGRETVLNLFYSTRDRGKTKPSLFLYPAGKKRGAVSGIKVEIEERIPSMVSETLNRPVTDTFYYHAKIIIPRETAPGLYLASLGSSDPFTLLDSTANEVALHCPEGFWSATSSGKESKLGENKPFFFRVPGEKKELEIFLARPHEIRDSDGTVIVEYNAGNTGKLSVPSLNRGGFWSISVPPSHPSSFAKLLNVEPLVTYASSRSFPVGTTGKPAGTTRAVPEPESELEFVPGIEGSGLRLTGKRVLRFPAGKEMGDGSYSHFPGLKGTVEFWYRPDWSTQDIILAKDWFKTRSFLEGPHVHLGYRYGVRMGRSLYYSDLILELLGTFPGAEPFRSFLHAKSLIGREEHHLFREGEWNHIAYTWAYQPAEEALPDRPILGDLKWPSRWRVFGPLDRNDPVLPDSILNSYPETVEINGKKLPAKEFSIFNTRYDFPGILRQEYAGRTAYVFLKLNSPKQQEVTLGMGADWWMQAWVNGKLVHDTTQTSNKYYPFSIWNHMVDVKLNKGENILAVRFIRGGGSVLALGGPRELKTPDPASLTWEFSIFVNGKRLDRYRSTQRDRFLRSPGDKLSSWQVKCETFTLAAENRDVVLGPLDGTMDMLRISDTIRYRDDFEAPEKAFRIDKDTKALFLFNGNLEGVSAFSQGPIESE